MKKNELHLPLQHFLCSSLTSWNYFGTTAIAICLSKAPWAAIFEYKWNTEVNWISVTLTSMSLCQVSTKNRRENWEMEKCTSHSTRLNSSLHCVLNSVHSSWILGVKSNFISNDIIWVGSTIYVGPSVPKSVWIWMKKCSSNSYSTVLKCWPSNFTLYAVITKHNLGLK